MNQTSSIPVFADRLEPLNRILDFSEEGYSVWGCSPIYGPDGKVHVFFARAKGPIENWTVNGQILHATADRPEGPYTVHDVVVEGRGGDHWDRMGLLNPRIFKFGDSYALYYTAADDVEDQMLNNRIGVMISKDLWNWTRGNGGQPVLVPSEDPAAWNCFGVANAAPIKHPARDEVWLYYRALRSDEKLTDSVGLAMGPTPEGPFEFSGPSPVIDVLKMRQDRGEWFRGFEDPCVWYWEGKFHMLVHDLLYDRTEDGGWYFQSEDGLNWVGPTLGFHGGRHYWDEGGRIETPLMLLGPDGRPEYLFVNRDTGGRATGFVFKVN